MIDKIEIRNATKDDLQDILNIYGYYTEKTAISFEYETPSMEDFTRRFENISSKFPYLVAVSENKIVGYAYGNTLIARAAYDFCAELTIYLDPNMRKCGIGRMLYESLEEKLKEQGIKNLYVAGQWTNSPGGLPVAVASGKFAIQRILKKQRRSIEIQEMKGRL